MTYRIGKDSPSEKSNELPFIKCLICLKKSYYQKDIENKYCGFCHKFHQDLNQGESQT